MVYCGVLWYYPCGTIPVECGYVCRRVSRNSQNSQNLKAFFFFWFLIFQGGGPAQKIAEKMIFSTKKVANIDEIA